MNWTFSLLFMQKVDTEKVRYAMETAVYRRKAEKAEQKLVRKL